MIWIKIGGQKRRIEVALRRPDPTGALMPALRQGFFLVHATTVAKLRQPGAARRNFVQGAARACNGALQMVDEHPWSTKSDAFAIAFLPASVGNFFDDDGVAHSHDLMDFATVQTLAMGFEFALFGRFAPPYRLIPLAPLPGGARFAPFALLLGASFLIIALGIGRSKLAIHFALQATHRLFVGSQVFG
jgi:hypothetical protein